MAPRSSGILTMSSSRAKRLVQCERPDGWYTEGVRGGYRADADPEVRLADALKQVQSLSGLLGIALHEAARAETYDELYCA